MRKRKPSSITSRTIIVALLSLIALLPGLATPAASMTHVAHTANITPMMNAAATSDAAVPVPKCIPVHSHAPAVKPFPTLHQVGQPASVLPPLSKQYIPADGKYIIALLRKAPAADVYGIEGGKIKFAYQGRSGNRPADELHKRRIDCGSNTVTGVRNHEQVWKDEEHHLSYEPDAIMWYSIFFIGGEAIHYSWDFDTYGYGGARHSGGCININRKPFAQQLFNWMPAGNPVYVVSVG